MRRMSVILMTLLLCLVCRRGLTAGFSIKASQVFDGTEVTVVSRYVNDKYSLCLPGTWDLTNVQITLSGRDEIRVGETVIRSGEVNDLSGCLGVRQTFYNAKGGKMAGTLTILQGSRIPALYVELSKKDLKAVQKDKENKASEGTVTYVEADGRVTYAGAIGSFGGRGNTTFKYSKKPYQLKLPEKVSFSGMGKGKTWILLANWLDLSLLRNEVMLHLSQAAGIPCAVDCTPADVYINGEYNGLYLVTQKIQVGKERVNIQNLEKATEEANPEPLDSYSRFREGSKGVPVTSGLKMLRAYSIPNDPDDITGGFILEIEKSYRFKDYVFNGFRTADGLSVTVKEPTYASVAQVTYMGQLFSDFHKAVLAEDGCSPDTGKYYADFIDLDSFACKWWMEEISKNYDYLASSQFYFKDSDKVDSRIFAGPCWDYDLCLGNMHADNFVYGSVPTRDYVAVHSTQKVNLYRALYLHDDFHALLRQLYRERIRPQLAILLGESRETGLLRSFDSYADEIAASSQMNFIRWPESLVKGYYAKSGTTNQTSVSYLREFLVQRTAYLDSVWMTDGE